MSGHNEPGDRSVNCAICGSTLKQADFAGDVAVFACLHRFCIACTGLVERGGQCPICANPLLQGCSLIANSPVTSISNTGNDVSAGFERFVNQQTSSAALQPVGQQVFAQGQFSDSFQRGDGLAASFNATFGQLLPFVASPANSVTTGDVPFTPTSIAIASTTSSGTRLPLAPSTVSSSGLESLPQPYHPSSAANLWDPPNAVLNGFIGASWRSPTPSDAQSLNYSAVPPTVAAKTSPQLFGGAGFSPQRTSSYCANPQFSLSPSPATVRPFSQRELPQALNSPTSHSEMLSVMDSNQQLRRAATISPVKVVNNPATSSVFSFSPNSSRYNQLYDQSGGTQQSSHVSNRTTEQHVGAGPLPIGHRPKLLTQQRSCTSCNDGLLAAFLCEQCKEYLCEGCSNAHLKVRVTRQHSVIPLVQNVDSNTSSSSASGGQSPASVAGKTTTDNRCALHVGTPCTLSCVTCRSIICIKCLSVHGAGHTVTSQHQDGRTAISELIYEAQLQRRGMQEAQDAIRRIEERVEARVRAVTSEIQSVMRMHIGVLEERKRSLLQSVDACRGVKVSALRDQSEQIASRLISFNGKLQNVERILEQNDHLGNESAKAWDALLELLQHAPMALQPRDTDELSFGKPDPAVLERLSTLGEIRTTACWKTTCILGDTFRRAIRNREYQATVQLRDPMGQPCVELATGDDEQCLSATIETPNGDTESVMCQRTVDGATYSLVYLMRCDGEHRLNVLLRGHPISGSPFSIQVRTGRDYGSLTGWSSTPLLSFGGEGSADGQFNRPWGICCDKLGRIVVADRSNNRIQIFDRNGRFIFKFGQAGTAPGRFDRPAGVTTNSKNHIVVADKDNHRVQIFDGSDGHFLLKIGDRGRNVGQFNYPWDVACDTDDRMAVSDTRNHRVQLFSADGRFVRKFGFDNCLFYKHFDSPRGVAFMPDGQLVITDFNNHRMVLVSMQGNDMKFIGKEGDEDGCFRRPQGVDVDAEGHVLVADSRNDRLQVFAPDMRPLCSFGGGLNRQPTTTTVVASGDRMDRPCDLCVSADGRVYVVDLGNNMVHVY